MTNIKSKNISSKLSKIYQDNIIDTLKHKNKVKIGQILKNYRTAKNISINKMAYELKISSSKIKDYEKGDKLISNRNFIKICNLLMININDFIQRIKTFDDI